MRKWYSINAKSDVKSAATIFIYGDIGQDVFGETTSASEFVRDLNALQNEEIDIRINSVGGSVPDGLAIHNAIQRHPSAVTIHIDGMAVSIASLIAMASTSVMAENAIMMVHAPFTFAMGNATDMRNTGDALDRWGEAMAASYARKTGRTADDILAELLDGQDHYFTAQEALEFGLVDSVVEAMPVAASAKIEESSAQRFGELPDTAAQFLTHESNRGGKMPKAKTPRAGERLAALLNREIDDQATEERPRADIIEEMATAAGISAGTVNQILNASINCPPLNRLEGFAEVLNVSQDSLIEAGNADGCDYESDDAGAAGATPRASRTGEGNMPNDNAQTFSAEDRAEIEAAGAKREATRRSEIETKFKPFASSPAVAELMNTCLADHTITVDAASKKLLDELGKEGEPVAGHVVVRDNPEREKFQAGIVATILARSGKADAETKTLAKHSGFHNFHLMEIAKASLSRANIDFSAMNHQQIAQAALTQTTSDFPVLLENAMHKAMLDAYQGAPDTWNRFARTGSVSDFRAHNRYRTGSIGNYQTVNEAGEYEHVAIPDAEKSTISAQDRGLIIGVTYQMLINDDIGGFMSLASDAGRAGRRSIESAVYAMLAENGGLGPNMLDGNPLFDASHGNIGTGAALSIASIDADRVLMGSQQDISGNDFLDLRPSIWLGPLASGGTARVINDSQFDPDSTNALQRPNKVRGLFTDVVDTARLSGTRYYLFANPNDAPVLEVAFLNGESEPMLVMEEQFSSRGTKWRATLDFGVGVVDYRGAVTNAGQ